MFPSKCFLSLLLIAISLGKSVMATPAFRTLEITRRRNITGFSNIVDADHFRDRALMSLSQRELSGSRKRAAIPITNSGVEYTANVGIGSPPTQYSLLVDTGSGNTWVGSNPANPYVTSSSSQATGRRIDVEYEIGSVYGPEWFDTVILSPDLVIETQAISAAITFSGFRGVDGVLGLGPITLTAGSVVGSSDMVLTVLNNLVSEGTIATESVGVYLEPTTTQGNTNGELSFGGPNLARITGNIGYVPITNTVPSTVYWGFDIVSINYGSVPILGATAGVVDTGSTLIGLSTQAYEAYTHATGAVYDEVTDLLKITPAQYNNLQNLDFTIGPNTYSLTPNGQIWPRSLYGINGGDPNFVYLVFRDTGGNSGSGLDFYLGYTFLERFYVDLDTTGNRIGFATTAQTTANSN